MSQSSIKRFFITEREEPKEKRIKQLSIKSFAVPVEHNSEDEVKIISAVGEKEKLKVARPVGRPRKSVDLNIEEFHDYNDLLKETIRSVFYVLFYSIIN